MFASLVLVSPVGLGDVAHHRVGYLLVSLELSKNLLFLPSPRRTNLIPAPYPVIDSDSMGGAMDYPLLILLLVLHDDSEGSDSPVFAKPRLELSEGHLLHEVFLDVLLELSPHEVLVILYRGIVRNPRQSRFPAILIQSPGGLFFENVRSSR